MPSIDLASIMGKVEAYSRSAKGKLRMRECVKKYFSEGVEKTAAGDRIVTEKEMTEAALKLIGVLRSTAQSHGLPASVMKHFDLLEYSSVRKMPDGSAAIYIYFGGDLHRESLYSDGYDGIDNIVALLNNGYNAKDYVYGYWDNHAPSGESVFDGRSISSSAYIRSRKNREGLNFIGQAIRDFNGNYGSVYNVTAVAGEDYKI